MAGDFKIKSTAKTVGSKKADAQAERLEEIEAKKAADKTAAKEAREKQLAKKKAEEAAKEAAEAEAKERARKSAEQLETIGKIGAAAIAVGGTAIGNAAKKKTGSSLKGKLVAIIIIALLAFAAYLAWPHIQEAMAPEQQAPASSQLDSGIMNKTEVFDNAILGEARQKQELIVWEQDVEVESQLTTALADLDIFRKTKVVRSFGTGVYTVDMGKVNEDAITVDEETHEITLLIPRTQLQYITKDLKATEFEDTQRSIFGFGDIKLTQEQQNQLEQHIEDSMRTELETVDCFDAADSAALLVVYDVYQPLITEIDDTYTLTVQFAEER